MRCGFKYILLLIMAYFSLAAGQDNAAERDNTFSITLSLSEYQTKEFVLNKVNHSGLFPSLALAYSIPSDVTRHTIGLNLLFNQLASSFESEAATFATRLTLNYSYFKKVSQINPGLELYFGGVGGTDYNISYFENWDESHFYWLTQYYAGMTGRLSWQQASGGQWLLDMQLPLLALVSRPADRFKRSEIDPKFSAIVGDIHNNIQWVTINRHFDLQLALQYSFFLTDSFQSALSWRFNYLNNQLTDSKKLIILTHTFGIIFFF